MNSGQLESKVSDDEFSTPSNDTGTDNTFDSEIKKQKRSNSLNGNRYDINGNKITTEIGRYSLSNVSARSKSVKERKESRKSLNSSQLSGGTGEGQSLEKEKNKKRHRITFMDEVTGDKSMLVEVHCIESYKKYNQEFYMEN